MTGVILVVDDVPANVKLLEAKLSNEYYDVITAKDGYEAIAQAKAHKPDLILLDVMMPGMDGFETCSRLKKDPEVSHIPVVMVTALSEPSDRVQGLEVGADDFITKPINDTALFARVKSLIRIKVLIDELRLRDQSGTQMGIMNDLVAINFDASGSKVWIVDDDAVQCRHMKDKLSEHYKTTVFINHIEAIERARQEQEEVDVIIISSLLAEIDGLRLATQIKAVEGMRHVPIIMLVDEHDQNLMLKALELGVNDYLIVPVDYNEMLARVKTQIRRKKYQDALKSNYQESVSMAITDRLTSLYNRHYLDTHLQNLVQASLQKGKQMSMLIMDMDHFKLVNDNYGHDVGDEVLRQLAQIIIKATRSSDLAARYGGEEFVILMPETPFSNAYDVAERIRRTVETNPFTVSHEIGLLSKTVSIGVSTLVESDTPEKLLKRADNALYEAKHSGRNRVCPSTEDIIHAPVSRKPVQVAHVMPPVHATFHKKPEVQPTPVPAPAVPTPVAENKVYNFDPKLHEKATTVTSAGQGPNQVPLTKEQAEQLYEVKRPQVAGAKQSHKAADSPIDNEPPGTF